MREMEREKEWMDERTKEWMDERKNKWKEEQVKLEATGPGAQLAIPSLTRIWLGDRDRE